MAFFTYKSKIIKSLIWLTFFVAALALGVGIGIYRMLDFENSTAVFTNGSWMGSKNLPLGEDKLVTAQITTFALFALPSSEAIYLMALKDHNKEPLNADNDYELNFNVHDIKAKYWSITAYGTDLFLIPNDENRYSFNNESLETDSLGNCSINLSAIAKEGNWLPIPKKGKFYLILRIYIGETKFIESLDNCSLPVIINSSKL